MRSVILAAALAAGVLGCKKKAEEPAKKPVADRPVAEAEADDDSRKDRREPRHEDNFPRNKPGPPKLVDAKVQVDAPDGKKIELSVRAIDGWLYGGGRFKPAEADTIWYPRLAFEAVDGAKGIDAMLEGQRTRWEAPNSGTGKPGLDDVRQKVDVIDQGALGADGKYLVLRVNKPDGPGAYPHIVTANCMRKHGDLVVHTSAWAPVEEEKGPLWPLLVEACKATKY